jgi:hypothetical protein
MTQLDLTVASEERHQRFVQRVVASEIVWGLKDSEGWVTSSSTNDETEDRPIMPFWSDRAYAKQCAKDEWSVYEPTEIPLDLFLEHWLPGMEGDGYLVGTNWNAQLSGHEVEPSQLLEEINACKAAAG